MRDGSSFARGDKVMQTDNDYEKEVFNGDIGFVTATDPPGGALTVSFDGRPVHYTSDQLDSLVPAYATTIHKAQGSEYPAVVVVLSNAHYPMLAQEPPLHGADPWQAPRRAPRRASGGAARRRGRDGSAALDEAQRAARPP